MNTEKIEFDCGSCQSPVSVPVHQAGRTTTCRRCGELIRIPGRSDAIALEVAHHKSTDSPRIPIGMLLLLVVGLIVAGIGNWCVCAGERPAHPRELSPGTVRANRSIIQAAHEDNVLVRTGRDHGMAVAIVTTRWAQLPYDMKVAVASALYEDAFGTDDLQILIIRDNLNNKEIASYRPGRGLNIE